MPAFQVYRKKGAGIILSSEYTVILYFLLFVSFIVSPPNFLINLPDGDSNNKYLSLENANWGNFKPILYNSIPFMFAVHIILYYILGIKNNLIPTIIQYFKNL